MLVVEDDLDVRRVAVATLRTAGYVADEAGGCYSALLRLQQEGRDYAAVFIDIGLPDGSGEVVGMHVMRTRPGTAVVLASATPPLLLPPRTPKIEKPYTPGRLTQTVRDAIASRRRVGG